MYAVKNQTTQPIQDFPVFNNWNEVAYGWYYALPSHELPIGGVKSLQLCGQELVIFRGEDGKVGALDAYCPHMGTHLGKGKVVGNSVRCFFHHWQFNTEGSCIKVPCQEDIPAKAKVPFYSVTEKYGAIWVYPDANPKHQLVDFPEIKNHQDTVIHFGKSYERTCHHHVTMINGIDPQHLRTVHSLDIEMKVDIAEPEEGNLMEITLTGKIGEGNLFEKISKLLLGPEYSYSMRYDHGNNGFLTLMKDVYFFGKKWPTLHMIFAYRPIAQGRILVQPIFVTKKRSGVFGKIIERALIVMTQMGFNSLQGEDGEVYENMRFYPGTLLSIDRPVAQYIQYVNKLKSSPWKLP